MAVVDMWQPCCSIYNPQLAIPSARSCCIRKVDKNHKRLPAEGRDHLVLPDTGPNGCYRNSSHRSCDLHKQGYPDCPSGIQ